MNKKTKNSAIRNAKISVIKKGLVYIPKNSRNDIELVVENGKPVIRDKK